MDFLEVETGRGPRHSVCVQLCSAPVCELTSRGPSFSLLSVTRLSVISFLASCQGPTRYGVRVETPSLRGPDAVRCCVVTLFDLERHFPWAVPRPVPISEMSGMASVLSTWWPGIWTACAGVQVLARRSGVGALLGEAGLLG